MKTRKARIQRALVALGEWCRRHRHHSLKDQHAALSRRLRGHYQYFGVNGNSRSLQQVLHRTERLWLKGLRRRGQRRNRLTWERFRAYLKAHPAGLPDPHPGERRTSGGSPRRQSDASGGHREPVEAGGSGYPDNAVVAWGTKAE